MASHPKPDRPAADDARDTGSSLRHARVVFTGRLATLARRKAREHVRAAGGQVLTHVSRRVSHVVVGAGGWPLLPDGQVSPALRRAEQINTHGPRIRIWSEATFLAAIGLRPPPPAKTSATRSAADVCELLGIQRTRLHHWERLGLIHAETGRYDFQDVVSLHTILALVERGVRPETISTSLAGLTGVLPDVERPLAQLKLVMNGPDEVLAELDTLRIARDGQLLLNFDLSADAETPAALNFPVDGSESAETWFERGLAAEDEESWHQAAEAYRKALEREPLFPEAYFNLGNVLRALNQPADAEYCYRAAVQQAPDMALAWYNLADIQEEEGRMDEAIASLRKAIDADPTFADAHFNLALCYELADRVEESEPHWAAYLKLDRAGNTLRLASPPGDATESRPL